MVKENAFTERRRYIRLKVPVDISYVVLGKDIVHRAITSNVSADGFSFETADRSLREADIVELTLSIPGTPNPVHAKSRVIWQRAVSLQDGSPVAVGHEFTEIEEDNKNTFLKFLCDLLYNLSD